MTATNGHDTRVVDVRVPGPRLGVPDAQPTLSWRVDSRQPGWRQAAHEIELQRGDHTETTHTESGQSVAVPWRSSPLRSRERCRVRVRVWAEGGAGPGPWSDPLELEAGLLHAGDWTAQMIAPDADHGRTTPRPAYRLTRSFDLDSRPKLARLYTTSLGVHELAINGRRVGDHVLDPGWSSYGHRLEHRTHDVSGLLRPGTNVVTALLADGWYRGWVGFEGGVTDLYGDRTGLLAQLEVEGASGKRMTVLQSDDGWRSSTSPVVSTGIYEGELHDARRGPAHGDVPTDAEQEGVTVLPLDRSLLTPAIGPPVRVVERLRPAAIGRSPSGRTIVDVGQNVVGRVRIRVKGDAGDVVTLRHAEVLEDGELGTRPLRRAAATDRYVLSGDGLEQWTPRFTYHGFRYVEVEGWPGELSLDDLEIEVIHTDMRRTGWFACSDPLVERLHENVVWSMRGNFVDIPMDCPQRDERLGWTGDIQVFAPAAAFLFDCHDMLRSWLRDVAEEQAEHGTVPVYVPWVPLTFPMVPTAAWGDAAVVVPWVLYERGGDIARLREAYPSMRAWVDTLEARLSDRDLWETGFQLGDWLDPVAPPDDPAAARTDRYLVATAYVVRSARLCAQAASALGLEPDQRRLQAVAQRALEGFRREYVTPNGRMSSDAQTAYALALVFDLLADDDQRQHAGARLVELVTQEDHHIGTGFVGTPLVTDALTEVGAVDTAYRLLLQQTPPSWLYPVTMGATTIWERWDSMLPDGRINPGDMTSFNHYALGAVADWLHRVVAGLAPTSPGYRTFDVRPRPGGGLRWASAEHLTPHGRARVRWELVDDEIVVEVSVPPNTMATATLPGDPDGPIALSPGQHVLRASAPAM